jgi:hypothetical protein
MTYLFKVEKDGIEAQKEECHSRSEPTESRAFEGIRVYPGSQCAIALRPRVCVGWVWCGKNQREDRGDCGEACYAAHSIVEPEGSDEISSHGGIYNTGNAGTARNNTDSEGSPIREPSSSDCLRQ